MICDYGGTFFSIDDFEWVEEEKKKKGKIYNFDWIDKYSVKKK